uniref:Chromo domain-containing protein n=1 Tax=Rhabditophanes sp. KR3021 TaxID=114890 RepID=A0AC35UDW6_9BILA
MASSGTVQQYRNKAMAREDNLIYSVKRILTRIRFRSDNKIYYLVEWLDFPVEFCTWEPQDNILDKNLILSKLERAMHLQIVFNHTTITKDFF